MNPFKPDPNRGLTGAAQDISREHSALLRQMGHLQQRISAQLHHAAQYQRQLESDNLRLRAELMVVRTATVWGMGYAARVRSTYPRHRDPMPVNDPALREAHSVICQTGCVGHAHPWLDASGQCLRSGQACERLAGDAEGGSSPLTSWVAGGFQSNIR
jgi:hypothetical protein